MMIKVIIADDHALMRDGLRRILESARDVQFEVVGEGCDSATTLALVREQKERIRDLVDRRKQLGFPIPEGCADWWSEYEVHTAERPPWLPSAPSTATGPARRVRPFAPRES